MPPGGPSSDAAKSTSALGSRGVVTSCHATSGAPHGRDLIDSISDADRQHEALPLDSESVSKRTSRTRPIAEREVGKAIAIAIDPEMRARAERVWEAHNRVQPVPASKSAIYKSALDSGLKLWERELGLIRDSA